MTFAVLIALTIFLVFRSIRLPGIALVGLFCMFSVEQWAQSQSTFFIEQPIIINALFAMITGFALAVRVMRSELRHEPYPLGAVLVMILFFYAMVSTNWTDDSVDIQELWTGWAPYVVVQVLIAPLLVAAPKDLTRIFGIQIFVGGIFAALIILGTEFAGRKVILGDDTSLVGNPLAIAESAGITIMCAILVPRLFRGDVLLKLLICGVCMFAIIKSGSRGQLIALAFALIVAFPVTHSVRNPKIVVGSALVVLFLAYLTMLGLELFWSDSGRYTGASMADDYQERIDMISRLMSAWLASPASIIFGLGNSSSFDMSINGYYPHFVPVEILCEEGLIGAFLYTWMLAIVIREAIYVGIRKKLPRDESAGLAILVGIIVYMFMISLKQGSLLGSTTFFMSVILFMRSVAYVRQQSRRQEKEAPAQEAVSETPKMPIQDYTPRPAGMYPGNR